jgi:hypothetical protein
MAKKEIARAKFVAPPGKSDVEAAWAATLSWYAKLKFGGAALSKPDFDKIRAAMEKGKRDMAFYADFDGKWLSIGAYAAGKLVEQIVQIDASEGGDQKKWRERLEILKAEKLVSDSELKSFDKKHPDPDKAKQVAHQVDEARKRLRIKLIACKRAADALKQAEAEAKAEQETLQKLEAALKKLGG